MYVSEKHSRGREGFASVEAPTAINQDLHDAPCHAFRGAALLGTSIGPRSQLLARAGGELGDGFPEYKVGRHI